jgi:TolA-binding protein
VSLPFRGGPLFAIGLALVACPALADEVQVLATEAQDIRQLADALGPRYLGRGDYKGEHYVEERLIDGENFFRMKDYQRAAIIFTDIIDNYPQHAAYPDALSLFAESLFLSRDYLGAREWFRKLLDQGNRPGFGRFRQQAISRLIEIAIHLNQYEGVEAYFAQLGQSLDDQALYIKGKYLYFKGELDSAAREFASVGKDPLLSLKARYFTGVILTREGKYDEAIEVFKAGAQHKAASPAEQEVVDLMNLGAGRLYFEKDFVENASECYQRIDRNSPYFDAALYEAASVLVRSGDTIRAERTLEVLTVAMPDSRYIPRAKILRGNLLHMTGRYDEAEKVFRETVTEFTPVLDQLDQVMAEQKDPRAFFAGLMEKSLTTLDVSSALPPLVVKWMEEEKEVQHALAVANDLGVCGQYVRETDRLVGLMEAVLKGPNRLNAVPALREAKRRALELENRVAQLRARLVRAIDQELGKANPAVATLSRELSGFEADIKSLPTAEQDFQQRDREVKKAFEDLRQSLSREAIRLDQLSAMTVAIERFVSDPRYTEGAAQDSIKAVKEELVRHHQGIADMRTEAEALKGSVERSQYQLGEGASRDQADEETRRKVRAIASRGREAVGGGDLAVRAARTFAAMEEIDAVLAGFEKSVESEAARQIEKIAREVEAERARVDRYRAELGGLNTEAEEVVGGVTSENFSGVRRKFHDMILKADVGIIDVAWLRKEEHVARSKDLTKERLKEIRALDEEFREVKNAESKPTE